MIPKKKVVQDNVVPLPSDKYIKMLLSKLPHYRIDTPLFLTKECTIARQQIKQRKISYPAIILLDKVLNPSTRLWLWTIVSKLIKNVELDKTLFYIAFLLEIVLFEKQKIKRDEIIKRISKIYPELDFSSINIIDIVLILEIIFFLQIGGKDAAYFRRKDETSSLDKFYWGKAGLFSFSGIINDFDPKEKYVIQKFLGLK